MCGGGSLFFFLPDQRTPMLKVERKGAAHAQKRVKKNAKFVKKRVKSLCVIQTTEARVYIEKKKSFFALPM